MIKKERTHEMTLKTLHPKRDDGLSQINLTKEHPQDIGSGHGKSEQELNLFSYQSGLPNPTLKHQPKTEITDSSNPPFAQFVRDYLHMLKTQKDWSDGHYQNVQNRIEKFCRFRNIGSKGIRDIKGIDINSFLLEIQINGNKNQKIRRFAKPLRKFAKSTVNRYCAAISVVFRFALQNGIIDHVPYIQWQKEPAGRVKVFSSKELQAIFDFLENDEHYSKYTWIRDLAVIALYTGMRLGELKVIGKDVILKTDRNGQQHLQVPAWVNKARVDKNIPVSHPNLLSALERVGDVSKVYTHHIYTEAWKKLKRTVAPGQKHFSTHVLRHTAASYMANTLKMNTLIIAQYLGHRSLTTTQKYVHADLNEISAAQNAMNYGVAI